VTEQEVDAYLKAIDHIIRSDATTLMIGVVDD